MNFIDPFTKGFAKRFRANRDHVLTGTFEILVDILELGTKHRPKDLKERPTRRASGVLS